MYHFIVNPNSRSGKSIKIWKKVEAKLQKESIIYELHFTRHVNHATEIAKSITMKSQPCTLVALGGDGTVNEVINGIENFDNVTFAYIPTGSSNDFARSLGLPNDPEASLNQILHPKKHRYLDVGTITIDNGDKRKFVVSCGFGFDAAVCEEVLKSPIKKVLNKIGLGKLIYAFIALKQLFFFHPTKGTLVLDGKEKIDLSKLYFISSQIHKYQGGGMKLCPDALYDDGHFDLCVVNGLSRLKILFLFPSAFLGLHTAIKEVNIYRCKEAKIVVEEPLFIHTDGEVSFKECKITAKPHNSQIRMIVE